MLSRAQRANLRHWVVPMLYGVVAIAAGLTLPRIESRFFPHLAASASVDSAIAIYSSIASGMLALTGIVFSMTFVMVQFSASAYSPRLVLWIVRDPVLSHALGVFSATFLYAIAALAWVNRSGSTSVPFISAWVVVALLLASVGMFVGLIRRVGLLQVNRMLIFTGDQGRKAIKSLYGPFNSASIMGARTEDLRSLPAQTLHHHGQPRSLQAVNILKLVELATARDGFIEVADAIGDTLLDSMPLMHVFGGHEP